MNTDGIEKSITHIMSTIVEYKANAVVSKSIIQRPTGDISVMSFDGGTAYMEKASPFDSFFLIIEGKAEIWVDGKSKILRPGEGIIIPALQAKNIKAKEKFKMITAVIKSGYE